VIPRFLFLFIKKQKHIVFPQKKVIGLLWETQPDCLKRKGKIRYTIADLVSRTQEKERRSLEIIQLRIKRGTKNKHVVGCCRHGFTSVVSGSHDWPSSASGQLHRDCLPVHKSLVLYYWWKNRRRSKRQNGSSQAWQKCHIQSAAWPFRANGSTTARPTQSTWFKSRACRSVPTTKTGRLPTRLRLFRSFAQFFRTLNKHIFFFIRRNFFFHPPE
jgi:hypothetical protein